MNGKTSLQLGLARILGVPQLVAWYIRSQRKRFAPCALPLTAPQMSAMQGFFDAATLNAARTLVLNGERLQNPPFHGLLKPLGFSNVPRLSQVSAVTFGNVIVSHRPFSHALLFHELVHVEQYRQLGIPRFAKLYVRGFVLRGAYRGIPLEANAYALGGQFEAGQRFSVPEEVNRWIREERF